MFSRSDRLRSVGLLTGNDGNADAVGQAFPLQHDLDRRDLIAGAKSDRLIAVAEVKGAFNFRRPAVNRFQVQESIRILNQNFHTREVHVYSCPLPGAA
jgi:hypothetical protein